MAVYSGLAMPPHNVSSASDVEGLQIHSLSATSYADQPAVQEGDRQLTYTELTSRATAMARKLVEQYAIEPGDCIGLCVARGLELPLSLLAIVNSGAAYVPLDPSFPHTRLHYMADDSQCQIILGSRQYEAIFAESGKPFIYVEDLVAEVSLAIEPVSAPTEALLDRAACPEQPVYVIYTSGSTGQPKGVELPYRALDNLVAWQLKQDGFNKPGRTLQFTPVSFDVHFQEFFVTWMAGGTVVMVDDELRRDPLSLLRFIADQSITHLYLPFVALQQLAEIAVTYGPIPETLEQVVTAGEQLQVNRFISTFFERLPSTQLHNHYGPSETHVVSAYTLTGEPSSWPLLPPIGLPVDNVKLRLLNEQGMPVAPGETGELIISGDCLANGYRYRQELTAEKFPLLNISGTEQRCYRTGDLARQLPDGNYEYLGRIDNQVKIRGYRVEIGEIEAALSGHPTVREVAVAAHRNDRGEPNLAAYVVPGQDLSDIQISSAETDADEAQGTAAESQQLAQWQQVWDGTYTEQGSDVDPALDFCGWNSSYTGEPLPKNEMTAWVRATVDRVLQLKPRRVLEIGCGTGLILHNLAPHCEQYVGTDFSAVALQRLQGTLAQRGEDLQHVRLQQCAAHELSAFKPGEFDCIVLNSVTQHFPSADYLLTVVQQCCELLSAGGTVFIGDVTNKLTRESFFASLAAHEARQEVKLSELRAELQKRLGAETELVVEPAFFLQLQRHIESVSDARVLLKHGAYRNELGDFRYDVVLHIGSSASGATAEWQNWPQFGNLQAIRQQLESQADSALAISNIPNKRLQQYRQQLQYINEHADMSRRELRSALQANGVDLEGSLEPDELQALAEQAGFSASIYWQDQPYAFDVCFTPKAQQVAPQQRNLSREKPLENCSSRPLGNFTEALVPALRSYLAERMPEYMVPAKFMMLSQLPVTPTGKLDRKSLPVPGRKRPELACDYIEPNTELQKALAAIWGEVLDIDKVGLSDNFFDLGGNSILSLRVAMKVKDTLERDLPVAYFFQHPTLESMSAFLADQNDQSAEVLRSSTASRAVKAKAAFARGRKAVRKMR